MSNTTILNTTPEDLIEAASAVREAERNATPPATATVNIHSRNRVTIRDGVMEEQSTNPSQATIPNKTLKAGEVMLDLNGRHIVTSFAAAKASGFVGAIVATADDVDPSFSKGTPNAHKGTAETAAKPSAVAAPSDAAKPNQEQPTDTDKAAVTAAHAALQTASEAIGASATQSIQEDVVVSGVLPTDHLPEGITPAMVEAVAAGYIAQANTILRDTGASVDTLTELLNENELKDARLAVYQGDDAKLKTLGQRAAARMNSIPNDPTLLKELTAGWPDSVRVTKRPNGEHYVTTPNWSMSWSEAISSGKIKF